MAATDAPDRVGRTPECSVSLDRLHCIGGTGRCEPTGRRTPCSRVLVEGDQPAQRSGGEAHGLRSPERAPLEAVTLSNTRSRLAVSLAAGQPLAGAENLTRYAPLGMGAPGRCAADANTARERRRMRLRVTAEPTARGIAKPIRGGLSSPSRRNLTVIPPSRAVRPSARSCSNVFRSRMRQIRPTVAFYLWPGGTGPLPGRRGSTYDAGNRGAWTAGECWVGKFASSLVLLRDLKWIRPSGMVACSRLVRYLPPCFEVFDGMDRLNARGWSRSPQPRNSAEVGARGRCSRRSGPARDTPGP